jgi:DNA primase
MIYPQHFIDDLKSRADIVRIVEASVPLKKKGANFWGNCPFHGEKTPSFSVSPSKGFYKCFGCGKSGTAFNFIMETQGVSFPEAIKIVADKSGVMLPEPIDDEQFQRSKKKSEDKKKLADEIVELNALAMEFWKESLRDKSGKKAREYLENRGITKETIETFGIGYAPDSWDSIMNLLKSNGADDKLIELSGLVSRNDEKNRVYDRFRGRIIFPVLDIKGQPIAFGARILDKGEPKYLNSPETAAYVKGQNLYGIFQNKDEIKSKKTSIIVEGYLDLIALYQFGVRICVASLGTAFTSEQAKLLSRFARKTVVNYDGDSAGVKAARKAIEPLLAQEFEIGVLVLPNGQDPDDFIRDNGIQKYRDSYQNAYPHLQFVLEQAVRERNLTLPKQKAEAIEDVLPAICAVRNSIQKRDSFDQAMSFLRVEEETLKRELWKTVKLGTNLDSARIKQTIARATTVRLTIAEQRLLELLVNDEELRVRIIPSLEITDFEALATSSIFHALIDIHTKKLKFDSATLFELTEEDVSAQDILPLILMSESARANGEAIDDSLRDAENCLSTLRAMAITRRIWEVNQELNLAEQSGELGLRDSLVLEQLNLARLKRSLENLAH